MSVGYPQKIVVTDWRSDEGCGVAIEVDELHVALFLTPKQARQMARRLIREADKSDGHRTRLDYLLGWQTKSRTVVPHGDAE